MSTKRIRRSTMLGAFGLIVFLKFCPFFALAFDSEFTLSSSFHTFASKAAALKSLLYYIFNPECCCLPSASGKDYFEKKSQNNVRQILPSNQKKIRKKSVKSTFSIVGLGGKIRVGDLPGGILSSKKSNFSFRNA